MKVLVHACCGPCAVQCVKSLTEEGFEPILFFYNPNIFPSGEYVKRKASLIRFCGLTGTDYILHGAYQCDSYLEHIQKNLEDRCGACYQFRLNACAVYARDNGFTAFSTTLLISPYQDHVLIKRLGEELSAKSGVTFLYMDFRPLFRSGQQEARDMCLYRQKYCGCVYSVRQA